MLIAFLVLFISFNSEFSKQTISPFSSTVDFGISPKVLLSDLMTNNDQIKTETLSCNKMSITTFMKDSYNSKVEIVYYFFNGMVMNGKDKITGLYQIDVIYSKNKDLTSDDNISEVYVQEYIDLFKIKAKKKNGHFVSNTDIMNDSGKPKSGIMFVDWVWWIFGNDGTAVSIDFPTRDHIKMGQKSIISYKQKFDINFKCEE